MNITEEDVRYSIKRNVAAELNAQLMQNGNYVNFINERNPFIKKVFDACIFLQLNYALQDGGRYVIREET